ncbi:MAG TPA: peptide deformylase [Candidatus Scatomorpha merdigallinarum]|nr:peptide deformylase [Candidatus Scatomorpha merdigallinarum]
MAHRKIIEEGDSVLHKHCRPVTNFDSRLHELIDDMRETLLEADGAGLAAPQVGVLRRVVLVLETNVPEGEEPYIIELVNPEIVSTEGEQNGPEGCLSLPGRFGLVKRPMDVTVRAQDRNGNSFEISGHELTARAFCHELDHLEGKLFTQCATRMLTPNEVENGSWNDGLEV